MEPHFRIDDATKGPPPVFLGPSRAWCLFECGSTSYAVGLESVAEVVEVERLVRLPHSPGRLLGLCTLRREVVPVIDLDSMGTDWNTPAGTNTFMVLILRVSRGTWAVRINAVGTIVAQERLEGPIPSVESNGPVYLGVVRRGAGSYTAIDPESTWRHVRQSVEDWYCDQLGRDPTAATPPPRTGRLVT